MSHHHGIIILSLLIPGHELVQRAAGFPWLCSPSHSILNFADTCLSCSIFHRNYCSWFDTLVVPWLKPLGFFFFFFFNHDHLWQLKKFWCFLESVSRPLFKNWCDESVWPLAGQSTGPRRVFPGVQFPMNEYMETCSKTFQKDLQQLLLAESTRHWSTITSYLMVTDTRQRSDTSTHPPEKRSSSC